ncbi:transposase, partial [uncultured Methylobacterium sp.]|uniref:transposase n=1 Tax=uncultured Methylobacterium sp. TaxID=157278 RepID=UPI0035CBE218
PRPGWSSDRARCPWPSPARRTRAAGNRDGYIFQARQFWQHAARLLDQLPGVPKWVVGDRGYSSHRFRDPIWNTGARPAIPTKRNEAPLACPDRVYTNRNIVERLWARLKEWRAVATGYEKTALSFTGVLCLAAPLDWMKSRQALGRKP